MKKETYEEQKIRQRKEQEVEDLVRRSASMALQEAKNAFEKAKMALYIATHEGEEAKDIKDAPKEVKDAFEKAKLEEKKAEEVYWESHKRWPIPLTKMRREGKNLEEGGGND